MVRPPIMTLDADRQSRTSGTETGRSAFGSGVLIDIISGP